MLSVTLAGCQGACEREKNGYWGTEYLGTLLQLGLVRIMYQNTRYEVETLAEDRE